MERSRMLQRSVMSPPTFRRSQTEQGPQFRNLPNTGRESRNCIWITQEILNEFQAKVVKSHKVTIKFNTVKAKAKYPSAHQSRKLPPLFAERLRMLHDRAHTSIHFRDNLRGRPVKVIVDDITKSYEVKENDLKLNRNKSTLKLGSKDSDVTFIRSMDSGDEGPGDFPADVIDTVARANSVQAEHPTHVLPEIRAAPCPIHTKKDKSKGHDPMYTNSHSRDFKSARFQPHPVKNITIQQNLSSQDPQVGPKPPRVDINVHIPEQFPSRAPVLPRNMSSKDFVMSWLMHGSEPAGSNHFPDIIPNSNRQKTKKTPRRSHISE